MRKFLRIAAIALPLIAGGAWAQDPPSRVARISYLTGNVAFRPASVEEWGQASLNYPLTTGDQLWADDDAQMELSIGSAAIRVHPHTATQITNLDDRTTQINLTEGVLNIRLRHLDDDETFEIDTPNGAITLLRPGDYRIDAFGENRGTVVNVRSGQAEVTGSNSAANVRAGEAARLYGEEQLQYDLVALAPPDDWDRWCDDRERRHDRALAQNASYVPPEMIGATDLADNGTWRQEPEYGAIWVPTRVGPDWAPYRYGHWAWIEPWGWTWIDDAPWGFAPFHYGRWARVGGVWAWVPGPPRVRPVYAPALVAFVGGRNFNLSVGIGGGGGGVAWFPLGPREIYRPAYHVSNVYVNRVNVTNVTNITNVNVTNVNVTNVRYVNQTIATTAVTQQTFVSARSVHRGLIAVPPEQAGRAQVVGMAAPVAPVRQSVIGSNAAVVRPPAGVWQRQVVARTAPPPPVVSFQARQAALAANPGRPVDPGTLNQLRTSAPIGRQMPSARVVGPAREQAFPRNNPQAAPQGQQPGFDGGRRFGRNDQINNPNPAQPQNGGQPAYQRPPNADRPYDRANDPRFNQQPGVPSATRPDPRQMTNPQPQMQNNPQPADNRPRFDRPAREQQPTMDRPAQPTMNQPAQPTLDQPRPHIDRPAPTERQSGEPRRDRPDFRQPQPPAQPQNNPQPQPRQEHVQPRQIERPVMRQEERPRPQEQPRPQAQPQPQPRREEHPQARQEERRQERKDDKK